MYLIRGIEKLKNAALLYIMTYIIIAGFYVALFEGFLSHNAVVLITSIVLIIVAVIIGFIALFMFLIPSFSDLRDYDYSKFNTPYVLLKIGLIGGLLALFIGAALIIIAVSISVKSILVMHHWAYMSEISFMMFSPAYVYNAIVIAYIGEILVLVSLILLIVGYVGIIIGLIRLKDVTGEDLFLAAAILYIIGIFIQLLIFIAWILIYVGARSSLQRLRQSI